MAQFVDEKGNMRLAVVRQPLFDTQYQLNPFAFPKKMRKKLLEVPADVCFFHESPFPRVSGSSYTNMPTSGQLPWPRRFFASGVRFDLGLPLDKETAACLSFRLRVGEKEYVSLPLMNFQTKVLNEENDRSRFEQHWSSREAVEEAAESKVFKSPEGSIYIPTVQNFAVDLCTGGAVLGDAEIRCTLLGLLLREPVA